jgi:pyruvate dehydrogenase E1 component beta subunit
MAESNMVEAVRLAIGRALADDDRVLLFGEDVGTSGGVFRASEGLQERFGPERVRDTPLSEALLVGLAVGLGAQQMRPIVEIQFAGFAYTAIDQLANHAARMRNRTRGRLSCPMVLRVPYGGGIGAPEHHSESPEALFAHLPGLRVVVPSSPARAYGMLLAAIADPDPVVFMEPKRLYRALHEEVADDGQELPLDRSVTLREGRDVTLVSWGAMLVETLAVADRLKVENVSAEVIDVATLKPLDMPTLLASVERTGRCVVVQEAPRAAGVGAEISASIAEAGLTSLLAPIERVTGWDTIMPYPRLESHYMPCVERILEATRRTLSYG